MFFDIFSSICFSTFNHNIYKQLNTYNITYQVLREADIMANKVEIIKGDFGTKARSIEPSYSNGFFGQVKKFFDSTTGKVTVLITGVMIFTFSLACSKTNGTTAPDPENATIEWTHLPEANDLGPDSAKFHVDLNDADSLNGVGFDINGNLPQEFGFNDSTDEYVAIFNIPPAEEMASRSV